MIIGLDVGGTHTDVVLIGPEGLIKEIKVPTDSSDLFQTVLQGLEEATAGIDTRFRARRSQRADPRRPSSLGFVLPPIRVSTGS